MTGRVLGAATSQSVGESIGFYYTSSSVTQAIYISTIPMLVTAVTFRIRVGSTSGTAQLVKTPSGTTAANGTNFTSTMDLSTTPTADTTITVPLLASAQPTQINPGDALSLIFAGTLTSGVGYIQVFVEPLV